MPSTRSTRDVCAEEATSPRRAGTAVTFGSLAAAFPKAVLSQDGLQRIFVMQRVHDPTGLAPPLARQVQADSQLGSVLPVDNHRQLLFPPVTVEP